MSEMVCSNMNNPRKMCVKRLEKDLLCAVLRSVFTKAKRKKLKNL